MVFSPSLKTPILCPLPATLHGIRLVQVLYPPIPCPVAAQNPRRMKMTSTNPWALSHASGPYPSHDPKTVDPAMTKPNWVTIARSFASCVSLRDLLKIPLLGCLMNGASLIKHIFPYHLQTLDVNRFIPESTGIRSIMMPIQALPMAKRAASRQPVKQRRYHRRVRFDDLPGAQPSFRTVLRLVFSIELI